MLVLHPFIGAGARWGRWWPVAMVGLKVINIIGAREGLRRDLRVESR
jgi:hypothetical protein